MEENDEKKKKKRLDKEALCERLTYKLKYIKKTQLLSVQSKSYDIIKFWTKASCVCFGNFLGWLTLHQRKIQDFTKFH